MAPPGVDPELFAPPASDRIAAVRARYGLPERFVLFVGTIEPRKNLVGLLDGYAGLPADLRHTTGLVLVGIKGWKDDEIQQRIAELREEGSPVVMPGYVEEADLPALYGAADAFILPSFYEGFGMTVIEAMACGTPVIAADNSALPEAAGGAALLVDAHRPDQITEALLRVLTDDVLAADLRAKGLEHAGRFRWETSARAILGALAAAR